LVNSFPHLARRYPDRRFAFMSYTADGTFRQFFSYGYVPACNRPATMPPEDYEAGLIGVRDLMSADSNFRTYYVPGDSHTFTYGDLSNTEIDGVTLNTWVDQFVEGDAAWTDVGP
jgi:hypothetical protein